MIEFGRSTCGLMAVRPAGENLDAADASAIETAVRDRLAAGPVVLVLDRVRFADSLGLGLLVRLARRGGGRLMIAGVSPALRKCLDRVPAKFRPPEVPFIPAPLAVAAAADAPTMCDQSGPVTERISVRPIRLSGRAPHAPRAVPLPR